MKNFFVLSILVSFCFFSCEKEGRNYTVDVSNQNVEVKINNISKELYNKQIPFDSIKNKYPFFFDPNTKDEVYIKQRTDSLDLLVYNEINKKINLDSVKMGLEDLFKHIKYYYPKFKSPTIYMFSSVYDKNFKETPVLYYKEENIMFIALDYFVGEDNEYLKVFEVENFYKKAMNPQNIVPRVSYAIAETFPLMDVGKSQFLNLIIIHGKAMLLQDAFLPNTPEELKIGYTQEDLKWCYGNEQNMWNYLIQEDYLFSDDKELTRRFIKSGAFSKFFTFDEEGNSVDLNSPGGVGKWIGWQIIRKYANDNPDISIIEIMANRNFNQLFKDADYQP